MPFSHKILITGSNGFVGRYLIQELLSTHPDSEIIGVEAFTDLSPFPDEPRVSVHRCDITEREGAAFRELVADVLPDQIYHLAGIALGGSTDKEGVFRVNIDGARYVFDSARQVIGDQVCLLFMSTGYVYGACSFERLSVESDELPALGLYGVYRDSKVLAEDVARQYNASIVRCFNMTGPRQTPSFVVPAFAKQIAQIEKGEIPPVLSVGNLEAYRDFLDIRDAVRGIDAVQNYGAPGDSYNIGSGNICKVRDILDCLLKLSTAKIEVVQDPSRMRPSDIPINGGNSTKLNSLSGWRAEIDIETTLLDTLNWWRQASF
jgi:GDP-4-dehydro-6-deoxy-D-mannose reductase